MQAKQGLRPPSSPYAAQTSSTAPSVLKMRMPTFGSAGK
jgi:hypothetical protein